MKVGDLVKEKFGGLWRTGVIISRDVGLDYITVFFSDGKIGGGKKWNYYLLEII